MSDEGSDADRLRHVLRGEGSAMEISDDGLARILQQAHEPGSATHRPAWLAPLAVAAAAVLLLGGVALGVGLFNSGGTNTATPTLPGVSGTTTSVSPSATTSTSTAGPSTGTSTSVSTLTATSSTKTVLPPTQNAALAIYYVAAVPGVGTRLYREFHELPVANDPLTHAKAALAELFGGNAVDPDYTSYWPSGTQALSVTVTGDSALVDVDQFPTVGTQAQSLAVQQIVWTITAADSSVKTVQVTVNGKAPTGAASLAKPVRRASALDVEANVWILTPTEGATTGSPVKVTVYGTGNEGNVPIEIYQGTTRIAAKPVTTEMGAFAQASTTFTLPAGDYEVRAYNDNGKNGTLLLWDTKSFTVQ
jgi:Sporulation and spore germination/Immunoglobulin-like domain of bacterial spore germination